MFRQEAHDPIRFYCSWAIYLIFDDERVPEQAQPNAESGHASGVSETLQRGAGPKARGVEFRVSAWRDRWGILGEITRAHPDGVCNKHVRHHHPQPAAHDAVNLFRDKNAQ